MNDKYSLTPAGSAFPHLYRVRLLRDLYAPHTGMYIIKKGTVGGLVSGQHNLSTQGNSWIHYNAIVTDSAFVEHDAQALDFAYMGGKTHVKKYATVKGHSVCNGRIVITDYACVAGGNVKGKVTIYGNAVVKDAAIVEGETRGHGVHICGNAVVKDRAQVRGHASVCHLAHISELGVVSEYARVGGTSNVRGNATVSGSRKVTKGVLSSGLHQ